MELIGAFIVIVAFTAIVAGSVAAVWTLEARQERELHPRTRFGRRSHA